MKHRKILWITCLFLLCFWAGFIVPGGQAHHQVGKTNAGAARAETLAATYANLPLSFEANRGQTAEEVEFLSRGKGYVLFLTGDAAVLALQRPEGRSQKSEARRARFEIGNSKLGGGNAIPSSLIKGLHPPLMGFEPPKAKSEAGAQVALRMKLLGANPAARVSGEEELPGKANYFLGNDPAKWRANVATYAKVRYKDVYRGVDLVYYGNQQRLEHDFVVAPGADPGLISLRLEGSKKVSLDAAGNLLITVEGGEVRFERPLIYQEAGGGRREVAGGYVLKDARDVAFKVGAYDRTKPLVIDPVLAYSTYLDGSQTDYSYGIAADSAGNAYVTGFTWSRNFPTTAGAYMTSLADTGPGFVTKFNADGSGPVYSTYFGGTGYGGDTTGSAIAVDASGNAYVTGYTSAYYFATTAGAFQPSKPSPAGSNSAFVMKLNPSGSALVYSTFLGGSGASFTYPSPFDGAFSIAVDASGNAYVTGSADSSDFPVTPGAFQPSKPSPPDRSSPFVSVLNPAGTELVYSTYLGGSSYDYAYGIAVDPSGDAYVTGYTSSSDFPTTPGAFQATQVGPSGSADAFVTKLSPSGTALVYSTYLGGSLGTSGDGIAVDSSGDAYVTGSTDSTDFPTKNPLQAALKGTGNAFVTELNPSGGSLVYSTYLGGSGSDYGRGIALDLAGNAYVTGYTTSPDFPVAGAITVGTNTVTPSYAGGGDVFLAEVQAGGGSLPFSAYLGGTGEDIPEAMALDSLGDAFITGSTTPGLVNGAAAFNFPTTPGAFQPQAQQPPNCLVFPAGYVPFTQITSYASGTYAGIGVEMVVGYTTPALYSELSYVPVPNAQFPEGFCTEPVELAPPYYTFNAVVPTPQMRIGDFSSFTGTLINPLTGLAFTNNIIPPDLLGSVFAWPTGPVPNHQEIFVVKLAIGPPAQVANLANTVQNLVSTHLLSPAAGRLLEGPLNAALAALGDPGQAAGARAALDSTRDTMIAPDLVRPSARAAIRDLEEFILLVRLVEIFGGLKRSEANVLINAAESIIKELRNP